MQFAFDDFVVDTGAFELLRAGVPVAVEPRVFDLLAALVQRPEHVFSRDELIATVWKGRTVSDATISTSVKQARRALGDSGGTQGYIKTVRGRGFKFSATVANAAPTLRSSDRSTPRLHIWDFDCLSEGEVIVRGTKSIATSLATLLTRVPLLRLSADPVGTESGPTVAELQDRGVDWAVRGVVQVLGDRPTANIQLVDVDTNEQVWAENLPIRAPEQCVPQIVAKLEPQLMLALLQRFSEADSKTAQGLFLRAYALLALKGWNPTSFGDAIELLRESVKSEPQFALAHGLLSLLLGFGARVGVDSAPAKEKTLESAQAALNLDSMDSTVLGFVGCSLADVGETDRGEALLRNAIDLNPANAQALVALGSVKLARREVAEAIDLLTEGMAISPLDSRLSVWGTFLAVAYLMARDPATAAEVASAACQRHDGTYLPRIALAAARLMLADESGCRRAMQDALRIHPELDSSQVAALLGSKLAAKLDAVLSER